MATPLVPILFAVSPLAATLSQPTMQHCTQPFFITMEAMLSHMRVTSTPALYSSKLVSRAPCRRGLVSSANTLISMPRSFARNSGPCPVP